MAFLYKCIDLIISLMISGETCGCLHYHQPGSAFSYNMKLFVKLILKFGSIETLHKVLLLYKNVRILILVTFLPNIIFFVSNISFLYKNVHQNYDLATLAVFVWQRVM